MNSQTGVERGHGGRGADGVRVTHSRFAIQRNSRTEWEWLDGDRSEHGCGQRTPSAPLPPCHRSPHASLVDEADWRGGILELCLSLIGISSTTTPPTA